MDLPCDLQSVRLKDSSQLKRIEVRKPTGLFEYKRYQPNQKWSATDQRINVHSIVHHYRLITVQNLSCNELKVWIEKMKNHSETCLINTRTKEWIFLPQTWKSTKLTTLLNLLFHISISILLNPLSFLIDIRPVFILLIPISLLRFHELEHLTWD